MKASKRNTIFKILTITIFMGLLITFVGCHEDTDDRVPVTAISIESANDSTTIATHEGTLQVSAIIVPDQATDKTVTWSITNDTGAATIDQNGLVSAVENGTVTVQVVSNSDSNVSNELILTISNQVTDNREPLASEIARSNQNIDETMVGESADEFVPGVQWVLAADLEAYEAAITAANAVMAETPLTDLEVAEAQDELILATEAFNDSKQDGTKVIMDIDLGMAGDFAILSKTGISAIGTTAITGNIGVSPVSASYISGFGLIMDSGNEFSTSSLVTGQIYASDYQNETPAYLTSAIADMLIAYDDGVGRTADYQELYTGDLSGKTLTSGVYMWSNDVLINTDLTLDGKATDVFIFQVAGTLNMAANTQIHLTGGALALHVYWVVAGTVAIDVGSDFQGIIISMTNVSMNTGSSIVGMIYAQTSVSMDAVTVTRQ